MSMLIIVMMIIVIMMIVIMMIIIHKISQATTRRVWVQVFETIGSGSFNLKKDNFFMILIMILLTLPDGWRRSSPGHCIEKVTSFHSVGRFNFWEPTLLFSPSSNNSFLPVSRILNIENRPEKGKCIKLLQIKYLKKSKPSWMSLI